MLLLALVHAQNGPTEGGRVWGGRGSEGIEWKTMDILTVFHNFVLTIPALEIFNSSHSNCLIFSLYTQKLFPHLSRRGQSASDGYHV